MFYMITNLACPFIVFINWQTLYRVQVSLENLELPLPPWGRVGGGVGRFTASCDPGGWKAAADV